jgi:hypothetical protein
VPARAYRFCFEPNLEIDLDTASCPMQALVSTAKERIRVTLELRQLWGQLAGFQGRSQIQTLDCSYSNFTW